MAKINDLLIGAHVSAAGGIYRAVSAGESIGATCIQIFTANQRRWESGPIDRQDLLQWREALRASSLSHIMSHDSYLINLGSPKRETLRKSRDSFLRELERCLQLGITYLNFHPGSALDQSPEKCLDRICESLLMTEGLMEKGAITLLLETTAGQGSSVGNRFEHLAYIIREVEGRVPIGVCVDTCHIFAAGYDIRDQKGWDETLAEFDRIIGLRYLKAFHINDSRRELGSRVDRHADLGRGLLGLESFRCLMRDKRTRDVPKYLETPGGGEVWKREIKMLRSFYARKN